jgi:response regulator RpfG family c-di-GMP phosphodiesterase
MNNKILCVDDDANILAGFQRNLRKQFSLDIAVGPKEGLASLDASGPYAVVVADMQMPGMNGVEFLIAVEQKAPDTVRIMLTGNADQKTAADAVNQGHVFRFLNKPCPPESLAQALTAGLKQYRLITAERELLEKTLHGSIKVLIDVLSVLDPQAFGRSQRIREHMRVFAKSQKSGETWELELAAMLSQVGCVTIPSAVLDKVRGKQGLSAAEKDMLARVPQIAADLLANIPRLENVSRIVLYQMKNFDGSGFPVDSVAGEEIPLGSRLLRVLNDLVLFESNKLPLVKAFEKMQHTSGRYDPKVLQAMAAAFDVCVSPKIHEAASQSVTWKDLRVGHRLLSDVQTSDGLLIFPSGTEVSQAVMGKLRNFAELSGIKEPLLIAA